ncbi:peptidylprolyl isomerase [Geobacter sp. SVR]|uniref:FKBP-type peptidyl-prolyl cis-trans isomerase n=1 Tax=Geobacter sp. SVR TaxID=2495594 RepID=UPI00143EF5A9|nr:peptidylprolyl isomerase [Geobacter sp. SVR]BCS53418.1 FKBP-type peptidyl-prolyl cis-trans isomerase [Geobacter sp. SVR]GCF85456.1 FKBP-type peptidyl-prolyl cis-trans isomerase [Geobacter sp. SVR]
MSTIAKNTVVILSYKVSDLDGEVIDEGAEPLVYLHAGYEDIFPRIEAALEGKSVGDKITVTLQPGEAFGEYDAELVRVEPASIFSEPVEIGMQLESDENEDGPIFRVTDIAGDKVVLDGNHPLAGMVLVFECTVETVRPATAEEIESSGNRGD